LYQFCTEPTRHSAGRCDRPTAGHHLKNAPFLVCSEDRGIKCVRYIVLYIPNYTASYTRLESSPVPLWETQISRLDLCVYTVAQIYFPPPQWRKSPEWARAFLLSRLHDHTITHTTVSRTLLDEWSARRRDLYLTTHNSHQETVHVPGGIWTLNPSKRVAADPFLRPRGHWDRQHRHTSTYFCIMNLPYVPFTVREWRCKD
jgi:hypothetical protein